MQASVVERHRVGRRQTGYILTIHRKKEKKKNKKKKRRSHEAEEGGVGGVEGLSADGGTIVSERCNACIEGLTENNWDSC